MTTSLSATAQLSRRHVLKVGLFGSAFLATVGVTASLSGCSDSRLQDGYAALRASDLGFLQALIPVLLSSAVQPAQMPQAVEQTLKNIDYGLNHLSPSMLKLTQQLFDLLTMPITRGPLTGIWGHWHKASEAHMQAFLKRWENSSISLLRKAHAALLQLVLMAWYSAPQSWAHCGYPGPPKF
ncbi:twin-arginine translocation pathway signal protein [Pseudomonas sp. 5P_3.1_Bac2]|uniref:twin-arginine translocation pathway signal protein n=1 Tax=Pseudomonas sp. 5P_3.1_Bac2 TaxID=2971617 RepID=UPI0021C7F45D|nr:twin-arginine translocation pathway signal protein [Pseudomonas sp. 5P_3.1_Bac2]MCU1718456.1 twin-arginine translocation pathway signal protein [Pseudomonas sp. 5P_3.1_Bac2]